MKTYVKLILWIVGAAAAAIAVFFVCAAVADYRPKEVEIICETSVGDTLADSLKVVTWNIGYAGLGDNMDFFYDGGTKVRDTHERTRENLDSVISVLKRLNADIYLLQEVDECSKRTYRMDQTEIIRKAFPDYHLYMGYNYKSMFVPIPLKAPIGKVTSGVVILSRYAPVQVVRYSYPSRFPFPVSMFNLKRCLLAAEFALSGGRRMIVANTHNTAYDTGGMRDEEMDFIGNLVSDWISDGIYVLIGGDWNQYPPGYLPEANELDNPDFPLAALPSERLGDCGNIVFDPAAKTLRYLNEVYSPESVCTVTDYFFISECIGHGPAHVTDLMFRCSDHHPVSVAVNVGKSSGK